MNLTYTAKLTGNRDKLLALDEIYRQVQEMSEYMFDHFDWTDSKNNKFSKEIYAEIRQKFPQIHSKLVQKAMKEYGKFGKSKKAKKAINLPLIFDSQNFDIQFHDGYYDLFVKFLRLRFPIEGLRTIEKLKEGRVKQLSVKKFDDSSEYRVYFVCEVEEPREKDTGKTLGLDINARCQVLSDGKFFNTKELVHRKAEHRKGKGKQNIESFTINYVHCLTKEITRYCVAQDVKVLRLERLTNLRKKAGKEFGKQNRNFVVNNCLPYSMIRESLSYKCSRFGISIELINPAYTSQRCYKCGSLETSRFPRNALTCLNKDCGNRIHADLNGARNIETGKPVSMGQRLTRPSCTAKMKSSCHATATHHA